jgi:phosphate transport system permease protein
LLLVAGYYPAITTSNQLTSHEQPKTGIQSMFTETPLVRKKKRAETFAKIVFLCMALLMIIPLLLIVGYLFYKAFPILSLDFLLTNPKNGMRAGGIWAPLLGTFYLVVTSLMIAAPIGVMAAVYLNEYARESWFTRIINLAVVNLAGVPSIVHALFGLGAFVLFAGLGKSILAASLTLAIMTLPVIIASTKEALASVPMAFREACWNVGATRWQTIRNIVLPNSISGILTGVILQVSRTAGETAPIMFTGAVFFKAISEGDIFAYNLFDQAMALSMHLFIISTQVPGVPQALPYGTAVVLLGVVLLVNALSIALRVYLRARKKW